MPEGNHGGLLKSAGVGGPFGAGNTVRSGKEGHLAGSAERDSVRGRRENDAADVREQGIRNNQLRRPEAAAREHFRWKLASTTELSAKPTRTPPIRHVDHPDHYAACHTSGRPYHLPRRPDHWATDTATDTSDSEHEPNHYLNGYGKSE